MQKDVKFTLPEDFNQHEFIRGLQDLYFIQQEKTFREHYVYYDTFDWRLYNKSLVLCSTAQTLLLQSLETSTVLERATITVPPVLLSDFPKWQFAGASRPDYRNAGAPQTVRHGCPMYSYTHLK